MRQIMSQTLYLISRFKLTMKLFGFRKGGVHPSPEKGMTENIPVSEIAPANELVLLLSQNTGAPSKPVVKVGDHVAEGEVVAEAGGFVGAPVHSPVAGTVRKIERVRDLSGYWQDAIIIGRDEDSVDSPFHLDATEREFDEKLLETSSERIISVVGEAGIVGLGGAAFPTRVKLTVPEGKRADYLVINGAECEPFLTCDDRLMQEHSADVLRGALFLAKACGARRVMVGIENNKSDAIALMRQGCEMLEKTAASINRTITVAPLRTRYPQGSEKQLIEAVTGRRVPAGGLPIDAGCVVDNVATAFAAYQAVMFNRPLTRRIVTVTGHAMGSPGNFIVENGTTYRHLIEAAGGLPEGSEKIVSGGPMMGKAISNIDAPVTKSVGGILVMRADESHRRAEQPCIRCAKCVDACPMGLEPYLLMTLSRQHLQQEAEDHGVMNCLECGCCSYICPSYRPLLDAIRLSKTTIRKNQKKR